MTTCWCLWRKDNPDQDANTTHHIINLENAAHGLCGEGQCTQGHQQRLHHQLLQDVGNATLGEQGAFILCKTRYSTFSNFSFSRILRAINSWTITGLSPATGALQNTSSLPKHLTHAVKTSQQKRSTVPAEKKLWCYSQLTTTFYCRSYWWIFCCSWNTFVEMWDVSCRVHKAFNICYYQCSGWAPERTSCHFPLI